ncbi:MAG: aldehyde ferredoxin oxidoreductase family protein [Victivallales bacterium]|nr:aldehyde ferredoxin oxidoreductase family protein [Victivallales bacterium]
MLYGYTGVLLEVDLTSNKIEKREFSEDVYKRYIGGTGIGAYILNKEMPRGADALDVDNILMFLVGPFAGTVVPCSGRTSVVSKSPLTSGWCEADVGGKFGDFLKKSGYDGLIVKGRAESRSYINIDGDNVEIRNAENIWGEDSYKADEILRENTENKISTMGIGGAGELLSPLAAIVSDGKDARVAGRCGMGAVMGAKNLKIVVCCQGKKSVNLYDEKALKISVKESMKKLSSVAAEFKAYGTSGTLDVCHDIGDMPVRNWQDRKWDDEKVHHLTGQNIAETVLKSNYHCSKCPFGCGRVVQVEKGKYKTDIPAGGPEYETLGTMGTSTLVDDIEAVTKANDLCNRYGMDTISVGQVISFAFEAYEKGYITKEDTGGLELTWGNGDTLVALTDLIGKREGIGNVLSKGVRAANRELAGGNRELDIHVKGLEFPAHDPRAFVSVALGFATSPRGACHLQAFSHGLETTWGCAPELGFKEPLDDMISTGRKAELTVKMQNLMSLFDSVKICKFAFSYNVTITKIVEWLNCITGWDLTVEEFLKTGERIFNLKTLFNRREGLTKKDDILPVRFLKSDYDFIGLLEEYYVLRGWDKNGNPTETTLQKLGLK